LSNLPNAYSNIQEFARVIWPNCQHPIVQKNPKTYTNFMRNRCIYPVRIHKCGVSWFQCWFITRCLLY
jgi:hypothetical protein